MYILLYVHVKQWSLYTYAP